MNDLREILINEIIHYKKKNKQVYFLDCDVGKHTRLEEGKCKKINYIDLGICEQNAIGIAAGISSNQNNIVIVSSFAEFIVGRCWEQIKHSVVYNNSNVVIIGTHAGFSSSEDGASHQCFEDVALLMSMPEIEVYCPGFEMECKQIVDRIFGERKTPMYIRLCHGDIIYDSTKFNVMDGYIKRSSESENDYAVFSTGYITQEVITAIDLLENKIDIIHIGKLRLINEKAIISELMKYKYLMIVEEEISIGGLYNLINEMVIKYNVTIRLSTIHIESEFGQSGSVEELRENAGLSARALYDKLSEWRITKYD